MSHATTDAYRDHAGKRKLPTLDDLRVAAPCTVAWDSMKGNGRVRTCAECAKQVFNIASMTRADAEVLLQERGAGLCVRFYRRADGTILTSDCPVGLRARFRARALLAAAAALVGFLSLVGLERLGSKVTPTVAMGAVCDFKQ